MCKGGQSREALPSSDAAVMAANAFLLWRFWHHPAAPMVALMFFALACFGRALMEKTLPMWVVRSDHKDGKARILCVNATFIYISDQNYRPSMKNVKIQTVVLAQD